LHSRRRSAATAPSVAALLQGNGSLCCISVVELHSRRQSGATAPSVAALLQLCCSSVALEEAERGKEVKQRY
jgi:hypothetical protein